MIIELDRTITEQPEKLTSEDLTALTSLATSRIRGFNFLLGNKTDLIALSKFEPLGVPAMEAFKKIFHDQTKWANALKEFGFRVRLVKENTDIYETQEDGISIVVISLRDCLKFKIDDKPSLIAENLTDISFYTRIVEAYLKSRKFVSVNLSYNAVNGGGSTTKEVVENHYETNSGISLCVLDSDLEIPWGDYGDTAQGVISLIPEQPYAKYIVTHSREAENIIPSKILDFFAVSSKSNRLKKQKFMDLSNITIGDDKPIKYVDFKKGIKKHLIKTPCQRTNQFWYSSFAESGLLKDCNNQQPCTKAKSCTCILADGWGTDLLKSTVEYLKNNKFDYADIDSYMRDEWDFICKQISPYIIAPSKAAG